jgi:pyruvate dehydrogenase E2 component (dihydrolipoamide acetyltransferase)
MPKLGLTMKTGTVIKWLKNEGENVREKKPLLEIETEKLSYIVESPADGVLLKILAAAGEKRPVSTVIGYIGEPGEKVPDSALPAQAADKEQPVSAQSVAPQSGGVPQQGAASQSSDVSPEPKAGGRIFISPVAKKLAASMGIDYRRVKGSGPNGRIVKADILSSKQASLEDAADDGHNPAAHLINYAGLRRAVGETMQKAWTTIPMVTHQVSADAGALVDYRALLNAYITDISDKSDRVTIGELLLKLTAAALAATPVMNSSLTDEGIVRHGRINLGMATALDGGLIVPVIHDADRKGLLTISREAKDLAERARSGALSPDEVYGATFTVSNLGSYGSVDFFTPIIDPPQAAILGIGRVTDTVAAVSGEIKIRPMVGLSLTYDHRIIDGATAAEFIKTLMKLMLNPARAAPAID